MLQYTTAIYSLSEIINFKSVLVTITCLSSMQDIVYLTLYNKDFENCFHMASGKREVDKFEKICISRLS